MSNSKRHSAASQVVCDAERVKQSDAESSVAGRRFLESFHGNVCGSIFLGNPPQVTDIIVHEDYKVGQNLSNDIAVLRVAEPFDFKGSEGFVVPACLPSKDHEMKALVTVSGYGTLKSGGQLSEQLMTVDVPVIPDQQCETMYKTAFQSYGQPSAFNAATMFCTLEEGGGKDACQGDSGGPAIQRHDGYAFLTGVVSWGIGCAHANYPGVYAEVSYYIDWIVDHLTFSGAC
ncbi:hypothetical protein ISCGN_005601 [Ixodes scapularis]